MASAPKSSTAPRWTNPLSLGSAANTLLRRVGVKLVRLSDNRPPPFVERYALDGSQAAGLEREAKKVLNLLHYTKSSSAQYAATEYEAGYHSIWLGKQQFAGQRNPAARLEQVPFDFTGATVLDIGCNQGGMLFALADKIKRGVGVDYDHRVINAANRIRAHMAVSNLDFYHFNVEQEQYSLLRNFVVGDRVDIIFLLSICMWISNWRQVISRCSEMSGNLLFESNGSAEQQADQINELRRHYQIVELVRDSSTDDPKQQNRALYICRN